MLEVDAVVAEVPNTPVADLAHLAGNGIPVATIGDSFSPRRLSYATLEANVAIRDLTSSPADEHESRTPWT
jgi:hypothetical protein